MDEDPYRLPDIDESKWLSGAHLGSQMQTTNWAVVNCTTPANYFHVLRRQVRSLNILWKSYTKHRRPNVGCCPMWQYCAAQMAPQGLAAACNAVHAGRCQVTTDVAALSSAACVICELQEQAQRLTMLLSS